jgi:hypothetical protein
MYAISTIGATLASVTGFLLKFRRQVRQNCYVNLNNPNDPTYSPQISSNGQCVRMQTAFIVPKPVQGISGEILAPQLYNGGSSSGSHK